MTSDTNRKCLCTSSDLHAVNATGQEPIRVAQIVGKMVGGGVESVVMNYYRHIDRTKVQFDFLVDEDSTRSRKGNHLFRRSCVPHTAVSASDSLPS